MRVTLLTTTALLLALPTLALAQAASAPAPADPQSSEAAVLDEVIVTAQRQSESQQRAAVAVDVVRGEDLVAAGVTGPGRLGELAPALTVQAGATGNIFFIRGVGNFTVAPNSDPAVAFNYDGVYVGRPSSTNGTFFDLARIEVLKGPQGTLYGRNATGGAINVIPVEPILGDFSGYGSISRGDYEATVAEGAVNLPLGEDAAVRLSANLSERDGNLSDGFGDESLRAVRAQFKAALTDNLTVRLSVDGSHIGGRGSSGSYVGNYVYSPVAGYQLISSGLGHDEGLYSAASQAYRRTVTSGASGRKLDDLGPRAFNDNDYLGAHAEIVWTTGLGTLTVVPAWRHADLDLLTTAAAFMYRQREEDEQFSLEMRFAGERIGIFDYTVGALYYDEDIAAQTALSLGSAVSFLRPHYTTESWAPFARVTAHVNESLRLVGGVRYTDDRKTFDGPTVAGAIVCLVRVAGIPSCPLAPQFTLVDDPSQLSFPFPAAGAPPQPIIIGGVPTGAIVARSDRTDNSSLASSKTTYRGAVEYDIAQQSLLFGSIETGYRSGGFSPATGFETFQPEYITAYTLGLKNRFFENRVQLNIEAYQWEYRDQQVNHVGLDLTGRTANFTQNIGRSRIKGVEVEGRALVTPATLVGFDVQYLDTENLSFLYQAAVGAAGSPPPLTGCGVSLNANPTLYDISCAGNPAYNSPKWTVNLNVQHTIDVGNYGLTLMADTQYKSSRVIGFDYLASQIVDANWQSNAQVAFGPVDGSWSIAAFVRNIEDDRIPVSRSLHPTANILVESATAPRTVGVRLSGRF